MAEFQTVEQKQVIAKRVPPGDRWSLIADPSEKVHESLTEALEAYFQETKFNAAFYLDPLGGSLYAVKREEVEVEPEPIKEFSLYGEFRQGV
jgi:hypothetical protein